LGTDFAEQLNEDMLTCSVNGTRNYMSPEKLRAYHHSLDNIRYNGEKADMFAFGLTAFIIFAGAPPFMMVRYKGKKNLPLICLFIRPGRQILILGSLLLRLRYLSPFFISFFLKTRHLKAFWKHKAHWSSELKSRLKELLVIDFFCSVVFLHSLIRMSIQL
jgi:serine/threonine protein kinase